MTIDHLRNNQYNLYMLDMNLEQLIEKIGENDFENVIEDNNMLRISIWQ